MTDHNREEREALIEKAAKALADDAWLGHDDELMMEDLRNIARAALAVFEQAHTPTDDDLDDIIDRATLDEYMRVDPDETYARLVVKANALASTVRRLLAREHTPTDDERDELEVQDLATVIGNVVIDYEDTGPHSQCPITIRDTCADWAMEIAGEVQAAGFRRTVQGEATATQEGENRG